MSYELVFYEKNVYTGLSKFKTFGEALDHLIACTDRYTQTNGFYTVADGINSFMVVDLSPASKTIKLNGLLSNDDKNTIKLRIDTTFH